MFPCVKWEQIQRPTAGQCAEIGKPQNGSPNDHKCWGVSFLTQKANREGKLNCTNDLASKPRGQFPVILLSSLHILLSPHLFRFPSPAPDSSSLMCEPAWLTLDRKPGFSVPGKGKSSVWSFEPLGIYG